MPGSIQPYPNLSAALLHLGSAADQLRPRRKPTDRPTANTTADRAQLGLRAENLSALIEALESEAYVLRWAGSVATTADAVLAHADERLTENQGVARRLRDREPLDAEQITQLGQQVRDNRAAVVRMTRTAAFAGVPLFDGNLKIQVGGGKLELPDLTHSLPTRAAIRMLRGEIGSFQTEVIDGRLRVVEATLVSTAQTRSMVLDDDSAHAAAARLRTEMLRRVEAQPAQAWNAIERGAVLDVLG